MKLPNKTSHQVFKTRRVRCIRPDELELYGSSTTLPLSVDEHKHSPARMRYSKFVHETSRTTDTAPMLSFAGCQNSTTLTSLHCSIRSRVEVNFVMCAVSMLVGSTRNCSRFVCRYGFHEDVLDSVYVPILLYCKEKSECT